MDCEQVKTLLSEYIDGELAAAWKGPVERHLADCAGCRNELDSIRRTVALVESLPKAHAPAGLANQVRAQLQQQVVLRRRAVVLRWTRIGGALAAAATLVLVIKLGAWESLERTAPKSPARAAPGVKPDKDAGDTSPAARKQADSLTAPGEERDTVKDHEAEAARRTVADEAAGLLKEQGPPAVAPAPAAPPPREEKGPGPAAPEVPPATTEMQHATPADGRGGQAGGVLGAAKATAAERASAGREKLGLKKEAGEGESMKQEAPASDAVSSTSAPAAVRAVAPGAAPALPTFIYECKDRDTGLARLKAVLAEIRGSVPEDKEQAPAKDEVPVTVPRDKLAELISRLGLSLTPPPKNETGKQEEVKPAPDAAEKPPAPDVTVKLLIRLKLEK